MQIQHQGDETFIEHGTPGEPHHWRVLYIKWLSDGVGVTAEQALKAISEALRVEDASAALASARSHIEAAIYALTHEDEVSAPSSSESEELGGDGTQLAPPLHADAFQPETSTRGVEYAQEYPTE